MKHGRLANRGFRVGNIDFVVLLRQGIADDSGQDLIEYALLGAIIGIVSIVAWSLLATTVGTCTAPPIQMCRTCRRAPRIRAARDVRSCWRRRVRHAHGLPQLA